MARTTKQLLADRQRLCADLEQVSSELAVKVANGEDSRNLSAKRDRLESRLKDLGPAIELTEQREQDAQTKEKEKRRAATEKEAQRAASKLCDAANAIDKTLAELETKFMAFELARLDTERALRNAELDDGSKIKRTVGYALRWATWASAPAFAADSQLPRVEMTKRRSFEQSITVALPRIGDT